MRPGTVGIVTFVIGICTLTTTGCGGRNDSSSTDSLTDALVDSQNQDSGSVTDFDTESPFPEMETDTECPDFSNELTGTVNIPDLTEISGLVVSRFDDRVLWVHNDSGNDPTLFALAIDGTLLGTYSLVNTQANDWEDIASEGGYLYIGDIGDNGLIRDSVTIIRVVEPEVSADQNEAAMELDDVETLELVYPEGAKNAETLLVDPVSGDLFIVTKETDNNMIYRAAAPLTWGGTTTLELVVENLPFLKDTRPYGGETTGGDMTVSGDAVIIRDYWDAYWWRRLPGESLVEAFARDGCKVPIPGSLPVATGNDGQGEAIGFDLDGHGYYTIPEQTQLFPEIRIRFYYK